jgi:hypothetical protein
MNCVIGNDNVVSVVGKSFVPQVLVTPVLNIFSNSRTFGLGSKSGLVLRRHYTFLYAKYCINSLIYIKLKLRSIQA